MAVTCILVLLLVVAATAAAQEERIALGGPMRFSTEDVAFVGWFVGAQAGVWRVEPFGYLSEDADVWAVVTGAAVPFWRGGLGRLSVRLGAEIGLGHPAAEPGAHPLVGVGAGGGGLYRFAASVDRAALDFMLMRAGFLVRGSAGAEYYAAGAPVLADGGES